jgi:hypothetical protein
MSLISHLMMNDVTWPCHLCVQAHRRCRPEMDGLAGCSSTPELRGYHEVWRERRPPRNRASGPNRYSRHGHAAFGPIRIRGGRRGISKVQYIHPTQPRAFHIMSFNFIFSFFLSPRYVLRACVLACVLALRFFLGTSIKF